MGRGDGLLHAAHAVILGTAPAPSRASSFPRALGAMGRAAPAKWALRWKAAVAPENTGRPMPKLLPGVWGRKPGLSQHGDRPRSMGRQVRGACIREGKNGRMCAKHLTKPADSRIIIQENKEAWYAHRCGFVCHRSIARGRRGILPALCLQVDLRADGLLPAFCAPALWKRLF